MVCLRIISPALRVALSIALMRAPCSEAAFSRSARNTCTAMLRGSSSVEDVELVRLVFVGRSRRAVGVFAANTGGMICSAVGICAITDLKREKNSVQTSNSPFSYSSMIFSPTVSACSKPSVFTRSSITSMICFSYWRRSWS